MAFQQFTLDGVGVFNSVGNNQYSPATMLWNWPPAEGFKFAPGKRANPKAPASAGITRTLHKSIVNAQSGATDYEKHVVSVNFSMPPNGDLNFLTTALNQIVMALGYMPLVADSTPAINDALNRLLRGES